MKIYMIQGKEYNHIRGLWTNSDTLVDWVLTQTYSWTEAAGETDLDAFMEANQLSVYEDGDPNSGKWIEWSELFPTE